MTNAPVRFIVLHYSSTYADQDLGVEDIRKMHLDRGWNDGKRDVAALCCEA